MNSYEQNANSRPRSAAPTTDVPAVGSKWALAARPPLTRERIDAIRQRILTGAYDSAGVVEQVARRIIGSGDLTDDTGE
jgi:hypothetical protein